MNLKFLNYPFRKFVKRYTLNKTLSASSLNVKQNPFRKLVKR